jgi:ATP-dependent Lon protease
VLPIGGVKEKLLAAHRAGIRTIILPKDNQKDLSDVPADILGEFTVHLAETIDDVLKVALTRPTVPLEEELDEESGFTPRLGEDPDVRQDSVMH